MKAMSTERRRRLLPWALIVGGIAVFVLIVGRGGNDNGRYLDPTSTGRAGTKAMVDTLRELGADVDVTDADPDRRTTAVFLGVDGLTNQRRQSLATWIESGGTLVLADDGSPLNPFRPDRPSIFGLSASGLDRHCTVPALRDVGRVEAPDAALLRPRPPAVGCFKINGDPDSGAWLITQSVGTGNLVVLGGASAFTNSNLGHADNGLLAVTLLALGPSARVQVYPLPSPGGGRRGLVDLVSPHVKLALVMLAIAFVVYALWRARRLGRPVLEPMPVEIPGSELVAAVGRLFQRSRSRERAADLVRDGTRRQLAGRLGLGPEASADDVAAAVAARTNMSVDEARVVLSGPAPADEAQLVEIARAAETMTREVTSGS